MPPTVLSRITHRQVAAAFAAPVLVAALSVAAVSGTAAGQDDGPAFTFALIGDTPYGAPQATRFPALRSAINTDPDVRLVLHAGDVKGGSERCDDSLLSERAALYEEFADPFVLTPGDNEWTDCHRVAAGSYLPTERLAAMRTIFYPDPGRSGGQHSVRLSTQADQRSYGDYVENVRFSERRVTFATVHVVGSSNGLEPWSGLPGGDRPAERLAEVQAREAAALDWIEQTFNEANRRQSRGVLLMLQAEPVAGNPGYTRIRDAIVNQSKAFHGPVLLVHGDEHVYEVEENYADVPNLTRLETFGDTADHWLRVQVDPRAPDVFSWTPMTVPAGS